VSRRVLVVEDDLLNRMLYSAVLEGNGFAVELVGDGAHALAKAREFRPDVIIMDIQLPNVSGLELIEALQRDPEFRHVPILAVTAFVGKGEERRIRQAGAKAFMAKPISIRPLVATINGLLGEK
jgi:two-component system cell cycle response regulator DivK